MFSLIRQQFSNTILVIRFVLQRQQTKRKSGYWRIVEWISKVPVFHVGKSFVTFSDVCRLYVRAPQNKSLDLEYQEVLTYII